MKTFKLLTIMILAATMMQCTLFYPTAKKTNEKYLSDEPYDIIIVPGYPHEETGWNQIVKMRILWAKQLFDNGSTKNIMFSGGAVYSPYIESQVMREYAIALGIPKENIYTEENARHSTENLYYSYTRAKELGFTKIALASDPFQTNNLRTFKKRFGIDVGLLPVVFKELENMDIEAPEINVEHALTEDFVSITESETFTERINGTLGNNIRWKEEDLKNKRQIKRQKNRGMLIPKKDDLYTLDLSK